jgi:hypothetical protein
MRERRAQRQQMKDLLPMRTNHMTKRGDIVAF